MDIATTPNETRKPQERRFLPQDGYSRWNDLKHFLPLGREAVRVREKEGRFPKRVQFGVRCSAWRNSEIHQWLADPDGYRANGDCNGTQHGQ